MAVVSTAEIHMKTFPAVDLKPSPWNYNRLLCISLPFSLFHTHTDTEIVPVTHADTMEL